MTTTEKKTFTVDETARIIGVSRSTAYECVRNGSIKSVRLGRRILIPAWAVEQIVAAPNSETKVTDAGD